jgi:hypothetical protein
LSSYNTIQVSYEGFRVETLYCMLERKSGARRFVAMSNMSLRSASPPGKRASRHSVSPGQPLRERSTSTQSSSKTASERQTKGQPHRERSAASLNASAAKPRLGAAPPSLLATYAAQLKAHPLLLGAPQQAGILALANAAKQVAVHTWGGAGRAVGAPFVLNLRAVGNAAFLGGCCMAPPLYC